MEILILLLSLGITVIQYTTQSPKSILKTYWIQANQFVGHRVIIVPIIICVMTRSSSISQATLNPFHSSLYFPLVSAYNLFSIILFMSWTDRLPPLPKWHDGAVTSASIKYPTTNCNCHALEYTWSSSL